MSFRFEINKAIHLLIFSVHSLGGKAPFHKLCSLLYLADIRHLMQYGIPMLGDTYLSTKNGIFPFNILSIYKQLKGEGFFNDFAFNFSEYFSLNEDLELQSLTPYNEGYIAVSEATCLFETIREHKQVSHEHLSDKIMDYAWQHANRNSEVSYEDIALAKDAAPEFRDYIRQSRENECYSFYERDESGHAVKITSGNGLASANRALPGIQPGALLLHRDMSGDAGACFMVAGFSYGAYALARIYRPEELPLSIRQHSFLGELFVAAAGMPGTETAVFADCSRLSFRHFRDVRAWLKKHPDAYIGDLPFHETDRIIKKIGAAPVIPGKVKREYNL